MELLVMAYALKTSCAKNIIGVIPYFPYSKQCKMRKRGSIVCKLLASMLAKAGGCVKSHGRQEVVVHTRLTMFLCGKL
jgi:phosphoribosylpyrophosphate synthetase